MNWTTPRDASRIDGDIKSAEVGHRVTNQGADAVFISDIAEHEV